MSTLARRRPILPAEPEPKRLIGFPTDDWRYGVSERTDDHDSALAKSGIRFDDVETGDA